MKRRTELSTGIMVKKQAIKYVTRKSDVEETSEKGVVGEKPLEKTSDKFVIVGNNTGLARTVTPPGGLTKEVGGSTSDRPRMNQVFVVNTRIIWKPHIMDDRGDHILKNHTA